VNNLHYTDPYFKKTDQTVGYISATVDTSSQRYMGIWRAFIYVKIDWIGRASFSDSWLSCSYVRVVKRWRPP